MTQLNNFFCALLVHMQWAVSVIMGQISLKYQSNRWFYGEHFCGRSCKGEILCGACRRSLLILILDFFVTKLR